MTSVVCDINMVNQESVNDGIIIEMLKKNRMRSVDVKITPRTYACEIIENHPYEILATIVMLMIIIQTILSSHTTYSPCIGAINWK